jgi:hypothetical protein
MFFTSLLVDPTAPSTVYAGTWPGGVFKSTDSGGSWASIGTGLPEDPVLALALDTAGGKTLHAGSLGAWQLGARVSTSYHTVVPCRVFDSRDPRHRRPTALGAGTTTTVPVGGRCGIPSTAGAAAINVTVTAPFGPGHLTLYTEDTVLPVASVVNYSAGQTRAGNAVARLGPSGTLDVFVGQASGDVHVVIDVSGYFQ